MRNEVIIGTAHFRNFKGASWLLLLHHDVIKGGGFKDQSEAIECNEKYKYSILKQINETGDKYRHNGVFEFLIEYKNVSSYLRWKQANFPLNETENQPTKTTVDGFESLSPFDEKSPFTGLAMSTIKDSTSDAEDKINVLLDGNINTAYWWYSVGYYNKHKSYVNRFPAIHPNSATEQYFWMRIAKIRGNLNVSICSKRRALNAFLLVMILVCVK